MSALVANDQHPTPEAARAAVVEAADVELDLSPNIDPRKYWIDVLEQPMSALVPPQWCGAFALWCLHQAGLGHELRWEIGKGFLWYLRTVAVPEPGDIAYFAHWQHHAVVRCMVGSDLFDSIDGNQGPLTPIKVHERKLREATAFYSIAALLPVGDVFQ